MTKMLQTGEVIGLLQMVSFDCKISYFAIESSVTHLDDLLQNHDAC